jgi:glycosyltransferase involved in cell wall biosynthesis
MSEGSAPSPPLDSRVLLYVAPTAGFFLSHRLPIALAAQEAGYAIHVACPASPDTVRLTGFGFAHHPVPIVRGSFSPRKEPASLLALVRLMRLLRPDLAHLITAKPALLGGIAARLTGTPTVAAITGLGHIFTHDDARARAMRRVLLAGYRFGLGHRRNHFIFQNRDDCAIFEGAGLLHVADSTIIAGSGVDLQAIKPRPLPAGPALALMPCRMLRDKGVAEFVEAARLLRAAGSAARFRLLGDPDPDNPVSLTPAELGRIAAEGVVEWQPHSDRIADELAQASLVVLPSYREGFPKTIIDAAAAGRAALTTDVPGCRDAIVPGVTGELCRVRDAAALADVMAPLLGDPARLARMGVAAREHAEAHFGIEQVVATHLALYAQMARR